MIHAMAPFMTWIRRSKSPALMLDFDGTIAPIRDNPLSVRPYMGIQELLRPIARGKTRLYIISGRSALQLKCILREWDFPFTIFGCHGSEMIAPDGRREVITLRDDTLRALRMAHWRALNVLPPYRVERKATAVAAHFRGMNPKATSGRLRALRFMWLPLTSKADLEIVPFKMGLEIRLAGINKGQRVKEILEPGQTAAYLGDDRTDEDAFMAIRGRGLGILVSRSFKPTAASAWLSPPDEVLGFLELWMRHARQNP